MGLWGEARKQVEASLREQRLADREAEVGIRERRVLEQEAMQWQGP